MKNPKLLPTMKFDGDILIYKSGLLFGSRKIEIPVNIVLDYQLGRRVMVNVLTLFINKYTHGQKEPTVKLLPKLFLLKSSCRSTEKLIKGLDENIQQNVVGQNVGLCHFDKSTLIGFYEKWHKHGNFYASHQLLRPFRSLHKTEKDNVPVIELKKDQKMAS